MGCKFKTYNKELQDLVNIKGVKEGLKIYIEAKADNVRVSNILFNLKSKNKQIGIENTIQETDKVNYELLRENEQKGRIEIEKDCKGGI